MRLTFYGRAGCHLCEDMLAALADLAPELGFTFEVRDVDREPEWRRRFGPLVPVLMAGEEEICHYFLDVVQLRQRLARFG